MAGVLASGSFGVVLCIGADGHLAVEPEHHNPCGQTHDDDDPAHAAMPASEASQGACETCGCVDVALGRDVLSHDAGTLTRRRLKNSGAGPWFAFGFARVQQTGVPGCPRTVCGASRIQAQSLLEKRTIVLLV